MVYKLQMLKAIFSPSTITYQLKQAEQIQGLWLRVSLLIGTFGILYFIGAFYGIGNELLSKEITNHSKSEFEVIKLLFACGEALWGLFYAGFILFLPSLFIWSVTEIPFKKLLSIQTYAVLILVIGKAIQLFFSLSLGVNQFSSPLSFGVIFQYITSSEILISLFGSISLMHFWAMFIQFTYIKNLTEKSPRFILFIILAMYIFLLIISTLLYYIKIERLI